VECPENVKLHGMKWTLSRRKDLSSWAGKPLCVLVLAACFCACTKKDQGMPPPPVIDLPFEGAFYFPGEKIGVQAGVNGHAGFSHLELYLDENLVLETAFPTIDTLMEVTELSEGTHTVRVIACGITGQCSVSSVEFQVIFPLGESKDEESFQGDQTGAWFLSGWNPFESEGYDDSHSLRSASSLAVAMTTKKFQEPGNISFHVKNGKETLVFLVDGKVKSRWFGQEDWGEYTYTISQGTHVFKWIAQSENTYLDRVTFTPGVEKHTPGEFFGGGIIFWLDSTGLHGYIAAIRDGNYHGIFEIPWGCYGQEITAGNRAQSKSKGADNTLAIISSCALEEIAARYCHDLSVSEDGQTWDDWYLPAIDELNLLYKHREMLENLGGQYYWSSTSHSSGAASVIDFLDGRHHGANRNIPNIAGPVAAGIHMRPIRGF